MSNNMSRRRFLTLMGGAAAVAGVNLAGCGSASTSSDSSTSTASGTTYIIATDTTFAPFEFTDASNNFVGIDVDLLAACMKVAGLNYDLQSLGFDAAVAALESGQADGVIAGMSVTDARKKKYDFSDPYYDSYVCAAAKNGGVVASLDDTKGTTVAAKTGTMSADWAESIKDKYGFTISYFDTSDLMYQDVLTGNTSVCFEDYPVMAYGVANGNGLKVVGTDESDFSTPYGFAVLKGKNAELLDGFNKGLAEVKDNGTYDEIVNKYLKS